MTQSIRARDKKRQNRRQIIWTTTIVAALVLAMTWYDLTLRDYSHLHAVPGKDYVIRTETDVANIAADYTTLTIWQGRLSVAEDGTVTSTGDTITPRPFPQRQVDVIVEVPRLPAAPVEKELLDAIVGIVDRWVADNNLMTEIILDIRGMQAPVKDILGFCQRLRERLDMGYRVGLLIDPLDPADPLTSSDAETRLELLNALAGIYFYLPPGDATETFKKTESLGFPYSVIVPPNGTDATAPEDVHGAYKYFRSFIYPPSAVNPPQDTTK